MPVKRSSKLKTVTLLQAMGWGIYFIISSFFHSFFVHGMHDELLYIKQAFTFVSLGFFFSFILYFYYEHLNIISKQNVFTVGVVLIFSYLSTLLWMTAYKVILENLWDFKIKALDWINIHHYSFDKTFVFLIWSGIYYIISYWSQLKTEREKALKADAALNEAKYNMLKYQVNPHFLFNALNSIIGMIDEDKEKAKNMVEGLSEFFRYSLNKGSKSVITLDEEMEGIQNYLAIEKERYEDNLMIEYNITEEAGAQNIPGFIVHPLVENALKYGMKTSSMPLNINISAQFQRNTLIVKVINSGSLFYNSTEKIDTVQSTSIGINNITERLNLTYGDKAAFELKEINKNVEATITINTDHE